jgi:hypothetical protein
MSDNSGKEKRVHKRPPVAFNVLYSVKSPFLVRIRVGLSSHTAMAHDIAEGGWHC